MKNKRLYCGASAASWHQCLLALLLMGVLCVGTAKAAPANDNFANAIDLGNALTFSGSGNNVGATLETGEATPPSSGASVWYKWTAPASGRFFVKAASVYSSTSNISPDVVVSTGGSVSTQTQVSLGTSSGVGVNATFSAVAGTTYYIAVYGMNVASQGDFTLSLGQPPANDNFANAIDLGSALAFSGSGSNVGASLETGEYNPVDPVYNYTEGGASVWYKWTAPASGRFFLKAYTAYDYMRPIVVVSTGASVSTQTQVSLGTGGNGTGLGGNATFSVVAGTTYYIAVHGYYGNQGNFTLSFGQAPANDNFANAIDLGSALAASGSGNNLGASLESGEINPVDPTSTSNYPIGGASVWYKWTAPASGGFFIKAVEWGMSPVVVVSTGGSVSTQTQVCLGTGGNGTGVGGNATFSAVAGTTYYIAVHGNYGSQVNFTLSLGQTPANDNFANAIDLGSALTVSGSGSNVGASLEPGETNPADPSSPNYSIGGASVWWKWTAPATGRFTVVADNHHDDPASWPINRVILVETGTSVSTLTQVGYLYQNGYPAATAFSATAGTTYSIAVHGLYGSQGLVQFKLGPTPGNDNMKDATLIPNNAGRIVSVSGNTAYATSEPGDNGWQWPNTLWWKWVAPADTAVSVDTVGSVIDNGLDVMQATTNPPSPASVIPVDDAEGWVEGETVPEPAQLQFQAKGGQVYYFRIGTYYSGGAVTLRLALPPANDNLANAQDLGSNGDQTVTGDNLGATSEPGEGGVSNGGDQEKSVWWKYTEQVGGKLQSIDTLGSDFDTVLEVYTPSATGGMTLLRHCDNAGDDGHSRVAFPVTSGSAYYIRVFGKNEASGNLKLNLKSRAPATTVADHIAWARGFMETLDGDGGAAAADAHLAAALAADPANAEANALRAFTQGALLQQQPEFTQLLSDIGASTTNGGAVRAKLTIPQDSSGVPVTKPGSTTALLLQYLQNRLPALDAIDGYLNNVTGNSFLISLSDAESGNRYAKIDAGDVQILRAVIRAIKAASYFSQTYDLAVSLDTVAHQSRYRQLNPEALKSSYTKVLTFSQSDRRNDFRDALKDGNSRYQLGSGYARAVRDPMDPYYLFQMGAEEANFRANAASFATALDGSTVWNGTRVDLSKLIASGSSLRDFLMNFHAAKVIANTTPDPMFGGVLPDSSQSAVNQFFQKRGLLYDLSTYSQWAAELLPGAKPEDQTEDANPARDGVNNRMKYVFGLDPQQRCKSNEYIVENLVKNAGDNQKYLTVSFVRRIDDPSLGYIVAVSDDLKTWDRTHAQVEQVGLAVQNADGITETVTFRLKTPASGFSKKFLRIEVTGGSR